jgi:hypothetical protein
LDPLQIGGMPMLKHMRSRKASTDKSSGKASKTHHVPLKVMKLKKEFEDFKQGSISVSEYVTRFTQLSCYAHDNVDTDEKKQYLFLNRVDDSLAYALKAHYFVNFQHMLDKALVLEN